MNRLVIVATIKYLYKLKFGLNAIIVIKQKAIRKLISFTKETTPSIKLSATDNEMIANITTKKNDKKCFLCLKFETNSLKLKILII